MVSLSQLAVIQIKGQKLPEMNNILRGLDSSRNLPGQLRVQLVDFCNEKCYFCHNEGRQDQHRVINENLMWKIIDASIMLSKFRVGFTGGEPTLNPMFSEYVLKLREKSAGVELTVTTNGSTLENLSSAVLERGINKLNISIHSLQRDKYKKITEKDLLDKVSRGLKRVAEFKNIDVFINMLVGSNNIKEIEDFVRYFSHFGYKINILDILGEDELKAPYGDIKKALEQVKKRLCVDEKIIELKPKIFHSKCEDCSFVPVCGEGEYLRVSVDSVLMPCMYRQDLFQSVHLDDDIDTTIRKVALGYRRVRYDDI